MDDSEKGGGAYADSLSEKLGFFSGNADSQKAEQGSASARRGHCVLHSGDCGGGLHGAHAHGRQRQCGADGVCAGGAADCAPDGWIPIQFGSNGRFGHQRELRVHLSLFCF